MDPRLADRAQGSAGIIHRASIYEELLRQDGWRDFVALATRFKDELIADLYKGTFSDTRRAGVSDDMIRGMIYAIDRMLAVPAEARVRYEMLRRAEDAVAASQRKVEQFQH